MRRSVKRLSASALLSVVALACGTAQPPKDPRAPAGLTPAARAALESREAHRLAASLSDEVGPRLAGSPGDSAAVGWAERTMRALGLVNVHLEPVVVPVWRRGEEAARIVGGGADEGKLDVNALGWSGSTAPEGVEAEVVRAANVNELAEMPDDRVRGKVVFVDAGMRRAPDFSGYGQAAPTRYRAQKVAAAKGAAAALIRSVGTDADNPHTGATNRDADPALPIGALSNTSADRLARAVAAGPVRLRLVLTSTRPGEARSANVVGEVRGAERPDEVVLLAAHLDSWDTGRGAIDDAAGCGVVLDTARLLAREKPARTVRVVLFAAEENSRAGGTRYAEAHAAEADRIVLALEVDGGTDRVKSIGLVGDPARASVLREIVQPLAPLGVAFHDGKGHAGADVTPLVARGVPAIDLGQDSSRYFDIHHTAADTSDKLDPAGLSQITAVVAHVTARAAEAATSFGRVPPSLAKD